MSLIPRDTLDRQIRKLLDDLLLLGSMVEHATVDAVEALKKRDLQKAQRTYFGDEKINAKRFEIENDIMVLIATQQPMARDVRVLSSAFDVANELERMGDYAKGIARICIMMADQPPIKLILDIPRMAEISLDMMNRALEAFIKSDDETAQLIPREDDEVDRLYNQIQIDLITNMIADPTIINWANYLMWAAHNLERMADRVTNICERTIYIATGKMVEIKSSDDEQDEKKKNEYSKGNNSA